jgi:adenylate cyclase
MTTGQQYEQQRSFQDSAHLDMHRVAVLPFSNISRDPSDDYFADGLTEELISKLSLVKGLRVIARTSTMKYKGSDKGVTEIGRELSCGVLVEGSVRKAGNRIRVSVQVVDANSEEHLWADSYDNKLDDIFAIQDEIAKKVSDSLPSHILPEAMPPQNSPDTSNLAAYTFYLKAKRLFNERTDASIKQAVEYFTKSVELDPNFARAYVGLGLCYPELGVKNLMTFNEGIDGMKTATLKALELDPNLAEAHSLMSNFAWGLDDYETAEKEARRAIELNPNLADANFSLGIVLQSTGYPQSSLKLFETAHSLDPLSAHYTRYLGLSLCYVGRDQEALALWNQNMKVSPFEMHLALAEYYLGRDDLEAADKEVKELEALSPSDFHTFAFRGYIYASRGDKESTQKIIKKLDDAFRGGATLDRTMGYFAYFFGDMDGFFRAMFRAVDQHVIDSPRLRLSPTFEKARRDPRFELLLKKNGLDPELKEPLNAP